MSGFPSEAPLDEQLAYVAANLEACTDDDLARVISLLRARNASHDDGDASASAVVSREVLSRVREEIAACNRFYDGEVARLMVSVKTEGGIQ